ncbi:hypothetical protein JKF63_07100 [Porcisia hertigi]|uniref:Uncharacterized protein n=1 Tax=Porcisia hertigi TaxID=2761500 RepID=A0A837AYB4_9TRYP|nr:hypothetical protein JKF63_07100 [Porcisia hertigi]
MSFSRSQVSVVHVLFLGTLLLIQSVAWAASDTSGTLSSSFSIRALDSGDPKAMYTVTGCAECTLNASQRWCPTTMRCYPASDCTCEGQEPCIDLTTCFYGAQPTCRECVESGGVYCLAGAEPAAVAAGAAQQASSALSTRCYTPTAIGPRARADSRGVRDRSGLRSTGVAAVDSAWLTCSNISCLGGHCIFVGDDCPAEQVVTLIRSYELVGMVLMAVLVLLAVHSMWLLWSSI